jgi:hypothetical protein
MLVLIDNNMDPSTSCQILPPIVTCDISADLQKSNSIDHPQSPESCIRLTTIQSDAVIPANESLTLTVNQCDNLVPDNTDVRQNEITVPQPIPSQCDHLIQGNVPVDTINESLQTKRVHFIECVVMQLCAIVENCGDNLKIEAIFKDLYMCKSLLFPFKNVTDLEGYAVLVAIATKDIFKTDPDIVKNFTNKLRFDETSTCNGNEVVTEMATAGLIDYLTSMEQSKHLEGNCVYYYLKDMDEYKKMLNVSNERIIKALSTSSHNSTFVDIKTLANTHLLFTPGAQARAAIMADRLEVILALVSHLND